MSNKHSAIGLKGFTLVEILAALLLIGLILPVAMKGISMASVLASNNARKYEALELAEVKLSEILLQEDWKSGSGSGNFDDENDSYQWMMDVSDWTTTGLKQVDLTVFWQQRGRSNQVALSTLAYENE